MIEALEVCCLKTGFPREFVHARAQNTVCVCFQGFVHTEAHSAGFFRECAHARARNNEFPREFGHTRAQDTGFPREIVHTRAQILLFSWESFWLRGFA